MRLNNAVFVFKKTWRDRIAKGCSVTLMNPVTRAYTSRLKAEALLIGEDWRGCSGPGESDQLTEARWDTLTEGQKREATIKGLVSTGEQAPVAPEPVHLEPLHPGAVVLDARPKGRVPAAAVVHALQGLRENPEVQSAIREAATKVSDAVRADIAGITEGSGFRDLDPKEIEDLIALYGPDDAARMVSEDRRASVEELEAESTRGNVTETAKPSDLLVKLARLTSLREPTEEFEASEREAPDLDDTEEPAEDEAPDADASADTDAPAPDRGPKRKRKK